MSTTPPPNADELVSAYLDGQAAPDEITIVENSPELMARVEEFRALGGLLHDVTPVEPAQREAHLGAALAEFDRLFADTPETERPHLSAVASTPEPTAAAPATPTARDEIISLSDERERRRPRRVSAIAAVAAAVALLFAAIAAFGFAGGSGDDVADSPAFDTASAASADDSDASDAGAMTQSVEAAGDEAMDDDAMDEEEAMEEEPSVADRATEGAAQPTPAPELLPAPPLESTANDEAMDEDEAMDDAEEDFAGDAAMADDAAGAADVDADAADADSSGDSPFAFDPNATLFLTPFEEPIPADIFLGSFDTIEAVEERVEAERAVTDQARLDAIDATFGGTLCQSQDRILAAQRSLGEATLLGYIESNGVLLELHILGDPASIDVATVGYDVSDCNPVADIVRPG